jgi:hypothetical protein
VLLLPILLILFSIIVFWLVQAPPGDFLDSYIATLASGGSSIQEEQVEALRQQFGLDQPMYVRYLRWMQGLLKGDLGYSLEYQRPNSELIGERLVLTLFLALFAPLVPVILGTQFAASETLLRGLCFIVVTNCIRQLVTAHLTTLDLQKQRNLIELAGLAASLGLLLMLIPTLGVWGAIIAAGVADSVVIALGFSTLAVGKARR